MKLFHHDFNGEYTADQTGTQNFHQILATYLDVPLYAYIFRGVPDFTVSRNPIIIGTSEEDDESTDGDIGQVEYAYQMNPLSSGHNRSSLPEKVAPAGIPILNLQNVVCMYLSFPYVLPIFNLQRPSECCLHLHLLVCMTLADPVTYLYTLGECRLIMIISWCVRY